MYKDGDGICGGEIALAEIVMAMTIESGGDGGGVIVVKR